MELTRLKQLLRYDPETGALYLRKNNRLLVPDDYGMVSIYDGETKRTKKTKYDVVCWQLGNDKVLPDGYRVLHRNLDENDFRLRFLRIVTREVYLKIQEAVRNLDGQLKVVQHPEDQYSYILKYQENGVSHREVIYDIAAAKKRELRLRVKFAKIISAYCIFD